MIFICDICSLLIWRKIFFKLKKIDQEILQIFIQNQNYGHLTIVTGAFALCKIKFDVLPKNNSFGNPIPLAPTTI